MTEITIDDTRVVRLYDEDDAFGLTGMPRLAARLAVLAVDGMFRARPFGDRSAVAADFDVTAANKLEALLGIRTDRSSLAYRCVHAAHMKNLVDLGAESVVDLADAVAEMFGATPEDFASIAPAGLGRAVFRAAMFHDMFHDGCQLKAAGTSTALVSVGRYLTPFGLTPRNPHYLSAAEAALAAAEAMERSITLIPT